LSKIFFYDTMLFKYLVFKKEVASINSNYLETESQWRLTKGKDAEVDCQKICWGYVEQAYNCLCEKAQSW